MNIRKFLTIPENRKSAAGILIAVIVLFLLVLTVRSCRKPDAETVAGHLAELLQRAGQQEEADRHWGTAAEDYIQKGDLERALEIYRLQIERHPDDTRLRELQSRIMVQRDSMRIIDGALSAELDRL